MKKNIILFILVVIVFITVFFLFKTIFLEGKMNFHNPLNLSRIESQKFSIETGKDTTIFGKKGTIIRIKKNSFTDNKRTPVNGMIQLELKEIYSNSDIILSGLTTTSNGNILQSGGMLYISATRDNEKVYINDSSEIRIIAPIEKHVEGMKLFFGSVNKMSQINWVNPTPFLNDTIIEIRAIGCVPDTLTEKEALRRGLVIRDTLLIIGNDTFRNTSNIAQIDTSFIRYINSNSEYNLDLETHNLFAIKHFGYYNIDRFMEEYETKNIRLSSTVENYNVFNIVFIKLTLPEKKIYLEGYQLSTNKFIFGKSNSDIVGLPIGEKAVVIATSYYKNKPYFDYKEFTIDEHQQIKLELKESSLEKIRKTIEGF